MKSLATSMAQMMSTIKQMVRDVVQSELRDLNTAYAFTRIGTITDVSGPKVRFDGETAASGKSYKYLTSYNPALNDRVLMLRVGNSWVIQGKIN